MDIPAVPVEQQNWSMDYTSRSGKCVIYARLDQRNPGTRRWVARCFICCPQFCEDEAARDRNIYEGAKWIHARMWFVVHAGWHNSLGIQHD